MNFKINSSGHKVELWSNEILQFDSSKNGQKNLKEALRQSIQCMQSQPFQYLKASFITEENLKKTDVENILFYNVGSGCFNALKLKGIYFERLFCKIPQNANFKYYQSYELVGRLPDIKGKKICSFYFQLPGLTTDTKPAIIWYYLKKYGIIKIFENTPCKDNFYIDLQITLQNQKNITALMKPLLDAVICAFHKYNGSQMDCVSDRIRKQLSKNKITAQQQEIKQFLTKHEILGEADFVFCRDTGLQWSPEDHRLVKCKIISNLQEEKTKDLVIKGSIFKP